jgi:hypothetical protein
VDSKEVVATGNVRKLGEVGVDETDTVSVRGETLTSHTQSGRVGVQGQELTVGGSGLQNGFSVAAGTDGAVDEGLAGLWAELFEYLVEQYGNV